MIIVAIFVGILVTGGYNGDDLTSAEVLFANGTALCQIESLSQSRDRHTQSGLTACGGMESDVRRSCVQYSHGTWNTMSKGLLYGRYEHSSWLNPDGGRVATKIF